MSTGVTARFARHLVIFTRSPRLGRVKRRLARDIGVVAATAFYRRTLADVVRRRVHGTQVTYLRVAFCGCDQSIAGVIPPAAREVRIVGTPASLDGATTVVENAKAAAGDRAVSGFSWGGVDCLF